MSYLDSFLFHPPPLLTLVLSILYSTMVLMPLWSHYDQRYPFTSHQKRWMFVVSILLMLTSSFFGDYRIPLPVWAFLAFHIWVDAKYQELPDAVNFIIAGLAIPSIAIAWSESGFIGSGVLTGILLFIIFLAVAFTGSLGGGDIKLMASIGLYFPLEEVINLVFYGCLIGTIQGLYFMLIKKRFKNVQFPFGPALILGTLVTTIL